MVAITPKWGLPVEETGDPSDMPAATGRLTAAIEKALDRVQQSANDLIAQTVAGRVAKAGDTMSGTLSAPDVAVSKGVRIGAVWSWLKEGNAVKLVKWSPDGSTRAGEPLAIDYADNLVTVGGGLKVFDANIPAADVGAVDGWRWLIYNAAGRVQQVTDLIFRYRVVQATAASQRSLKANISPDPAPDVHALQTVGFAWRTDAGRGMWPGRRFGLIAEQVAEVDDRLVTVDPDGGEVTGLDLAAMCAALVAAVQDLQHQVTELKGGA